jgi:hypothetical protein
MHASLLPVFPWILFHPSSIMKSPFRSRYFRTGKKSHPILQYHCGSSYKATH